MDRQLFPTSVTGRVLVRFAITTLGCVGLGLVSHALANGDLFAVPVWLPAGLALVAAFHWGLPGVLGAIVGKFAAEAIHWRTEFHGQLLIAAVALALAAGAQAWIGGQLLSRWRATRTSPRMGLRGVLSLLLVGPASCLVGALVGSALIAWVGRSGAGSYAANAAAWWVGDSIAVLLFVTPYWIWCTEHATNSVRSLVLASMPQAVVAFILLVGFLHVRNVDETRIESAFQAAAHKATTAIERSMQANVRQVHSIVGLFHSTQRVDRRQFHAYYQSWSETGDGISSLTWVRHVRDADRAAFESRLSAELGREMVLVEVPKGGGGMARAAQRPEYFVIEYGEPAEASDQETGLDVSTYSALFDPMRRAVAAGSTLASKPLQIGSGPESLSVMFVVTPVYEVGADLGSVESRAQSLVGLLNAELNVEAIVRQALESCTLLGSRLLLSDVTESPDESHFLESGARAATGGSSLSQRIGEQSVEHTFGVAGRRWRARFEPSTAFVLTHGTYQNWFLLLAALAIATMVSLYQILVSSRAVEVTELVKARTAQLSQTNVELERATLEARNATRAKSVFLANMSHEIRTPMTSILGFTELLADDGLPTQDRQQYALTVRRNGEHLLSLINDILDVSKIEAEAMSVEHIQCSSVSFALDAAELLRRPAEEKGLSLQVHLESAIPETITTDPTRLRQILVNLVGNAVKFTETGAVRITLRCTTGADAWLEFAVTDTGPGMDEATLARLFRPFTQGDTSTSRRFGGTGLGLTISERLARLLGGSLTVTSRVGAGSEFVLRHPVDVTASDTWIRTLPERLALPGARPKARARTEQTPGPGLRCRVLVADDGKDNQRLLSLFLREAGAEVDVTGNGRAAFELVLAARSAGRPFDLVLMDMQMPELDGYASATLIRREGIDTPIVAITAHALHEDQRRAIDAGCNDYLTKPIERGRLLEAVRRWSAVEI